MRNPSPQASQIVPSDLLALSVAEACHVSNYAHHYLHHKMTPLPFRYHLPPFSHLLRSALAHPLQILNRCSRSHSPLGPFFFAERVVP